MTTQQDIDGLLRDRDFHAEKLREIDKELRKVRDDISKRIGGDPLPASPVVLPVPYPVPVYPRVRWDWPSDYSAGSLTVRTVSNTPALQTPYGHRIAKADA